MKKTILLLVAIFAMVACGKSDNKGDDSGYALKILKSEGVTVGSIVFQYSTGEVETDTSPKPLTKDYTIAIKGGAPLQVAVSATGSSNNSTLTIQLLQNGQVKKTATSTGTFMTSAL